MSSTTFLNDRFLKRDARSALIDALLIFLWHSAGEFGWHWCSRWMWFGCGVA